MRKVPFQFGESERTGVIQGVSLTGQLLPDHPPPNKGSAFLDEEGRELGLPGLLPSHRSTLDERLARTNENEKCRPGWRWQLAPRLSAQAWRFTLPLTSWSAAWRKRCVPHVMRDTNSKRSSYGQVNHHR
jgi:hypothetical protein